MAGVGGIAGDALDGAPGGAFDSGDVFDRSGAAGGESGGGTFDVVAVAAGIEVVTPVWWLGKLFADDRARVLRTAGIDAATLDLLSVLRRSGAPYVLITREPARRTLVTAGAVSQRVARAEAQGLVAREDIGRPAGQAAGGRPAAGGGWRVAGASAPGEDRGDRSDP
ncbi:MarR family transcriptional regulator [Kitasatospora sp. NPDC101447]|uniref:MarR family transcriptional regulator n=1 Tax=Kitasatospora sp. NPDC101447 TaxID=3364102 RepID=UPI00380B2692